MKNHFRRDFKTLRGRAALGLAATIIASVALLLPAEGCSTSEPTLTGTEEESDRTQTQREVIPTEAVEDEWDREENFTHEDLRLIDAADQADVETLRRLLQEGADPNETDEYGSPPPLRVAVALGNLEMVQLLLDAGADPDKPGPDGSSPALLAAEIGDPEILTAVSVAGGTDLTPEN